MSTTPMSQGAVRLLRALREHGATRRAAALTDARLAELTGLAARELVDLSFELIEHGWLVLAETVAPPGRWLLEPGADLAPARAYLDSLQERSVAIFRRRAAVRACIERYESLAQTAAPGAQLGLFV